MGTLFDDRPDFVPTPCVTCHILSVAPLLLFALLVVGIEGQPHLHIESANEHAPMRPAIEFTTSASGFSNGALSVRVPDENVRIATGTTFSLS